VVRKRLGSSNLPPRAFRPISFLDRKEIRLLSDDSIDFGNKFPKSPADKEKR